MKLYFTVKVKISVKVKCTKFVIMVSCIVVTEKKVRLKAITGVLIFTKHDFVLHYRYYIIVENVFNIIQKTRHQWKTRTFYENRWKRNGLVNIYKFIFTRTHILIRASRTLFLCFYKILDLCLLIVNVKKYNFITEIIN